MGAPGTLLFCQCHADTSLQVDLDNAGGRAVNDPLTARTGVAFERQALEQRAEEQKATEKRQALERANRYQACLSRATDKYNASRLVTCNRPREKIIKDRDDCIKLGFSEKVCAMAHVVPEASPNCTLPRAVALSLDAEVEKKRDRAEGTVGCIS
jgi:hypothetical protein